jgi:kumamolisin
VAATAATGTSAITITAKGAGITHTSTVNLTVTAKTAGSFTVAVSPTSGYLYRGQSGYAVVSVTPSGGFSSAVALSATGIPSGVTGSFSPSSITGSGSSDFTLTVSRSAPTGTYPIVIKGTGGGVTETTTLTLTVYR